MEGYLTKQGEIYRTWKLRWFVLKGDKMYYYEGQKDHEPKGVIDLDTSSLVIDERLRDKKSRSMFSVSTAKRVYYIYADNVGDMQQWMSAIKLNISMLSPSAVAPTYHESDRPHSAPSPSKQDASPSPRDRFIAAKNSISFLVQDSKMVDFWKIWFDSVPTSSEILRGMTSEYKVAISADLQKLSWRVCGPQTTFIQRMVDFFWNVGAPETEIDKLNEAGLSVNPQRIGSWIDMSARSGMDGGWFFPFQMHMKIAVVAADEHESLRKLVQWVSINEIPHCLSVGRDMGAAPPRQTEFRFQLPGTDYANQLRTAIGAFSAFGFEELPDDARQVMRRAEGTGPIQLIVVTSAEGFVRMGVLLPNPSPSIVSAFCALGNAQLAEMQRFQIALKTMGPAFVEYQYLNSSFSYGVYKEGFDVVFHYNVGEDMGVM